MKRLPRQIVRASPSATLILSRAAPRQRFTTSPFAMLVKPIRLSRLLCFSISALTMNGIIIQVIARQAPTADYWYVSLSTLPHVTASAGRQNDGETIGHGRRRGLHVENS